MPKKTTAKVVVTYLVEQVDDGPRADLDFVKDHFYEEWDDVEVEIYDEKLEEASTVKLMIESIYVS